MAAVEVGKEILWMKDFIGELDIQQDEYRLYCDSQSVIHLAKNAMYHSRAKHIQRRYHWIRERVEEREFVLTKIHTTENGSDMLGKHVPPDGRYREPVDPRTGTDRSRPIGKDTYVNMPKSHICINMT